MIFVSLSARCHLDSGLPGVVHISCDPEGVLDGDQPPLVLYKVYNVYTGGELAAERGPPPSQLSPILPSSLSCSDTAGAWAEILKVLCDCEFDMMQKLALTKLTLVQISLSKVVTGRHS